MAMTWSFFTLTIAVVRAQLIFSDHKYIMKNRLDKLTRLQLENIVPSRNLNVFLQGRLHLLKNVKKFQSNPISNTSFITTLRELQTERPAKLSNLQSPSPLQKKKRNNENSPFCMRSFSVLKDSMCTS